MKRLCPTKLAGLLTLALWGVPARSADQKDRQPVDQDRAVATVDGTPISTGALVRAAGAAGPYGRGLLANPVARDEVLTKLIDTVLLAREAEAKGLAKRPDVAARLAEARARVLADALLEQHLAASTDDRAVRAFFAKDPARFSAREVRASQLVLTDETQAQAALAEALRPKADFAALTKRLADPLAKAPSGNLGWFGRGRMLPEFEAAAFATKPGTVHPRLVKTQFGFHVIKVEEERGSDVVDSATVKERVADAYREELRAGLLADLQRRAKVVVNSEAVRRLGTITQ